MVSFQRKKNVIEKNSNNLQLLVKKFTSHFVIAPHERRIHGSKENYDHVIHDPT